MLSALAILLNFTTPQAAVIVDPAPADPILVAYEKVNLQERSRSEIRTPRLEVPVPPGLFTHYKNLDIPAAMLNRAFDPANHVEEGFHFDPNKIGKIDMQVSEPFLQNRGITEVIGVGVSTFAGSTEARLHNIMRSLEVYDGRIIAAGEVFSFNKNLGGVTEEDGYQWARTIVNGEDRWGIGGGICQVSTTLFRSALNAGLPIKDRRAHSFSLSQYYAPAGLDATIYKGSQDLKFTNDTGADALIRVVRRGDEIAVFMFGTRDRSVTLEKTSHWQGYDGRMATHWTRTVKKGVITFHEGFASHYRASY